MDQKNLYKEYQSVIATVSAEMGTVLLDIKPYCTTVDLMVSFVKKLSRKMKRRPFILYMDQLSAHRSKKVKEECRKHGITICYNISYTPELNPIETCFSYVKQAFKKRRLNALVNKAEFNFVAEIKRAFKNLAPATVAACIKRSLFLLNTVK